METHLRKSERELTFTFHAEQFASVRLRDARKKMPRPQTGR